MRVLLSLLVVAASLLPLPARAAETVVRNDSTTGGLPSTVANLFLAGESPAAWLSATCTGDIVALQVYWASQLGGAPDSLEMSLTLLQGDNLTYPTPGAVLTNDGGANAVVSMPTLSEAVMNEFRFLDPPTNAVPLRVPIVHGQPFVVSLTLFNTSSGSPFAPSIVYDQDGCQPFRNAVDVIPGGWTDACAAGVTGDWVIRAVIDCDATQVPALPDRGVALLGLVLVAAAIGAALRATASRAAAR